MKVKILAVSGISAYDFKQVPIIRLQGKWLERLDFRIGRKIEVAYCEGIVVIKIISDNRSDIKNGGEDGQDELL